MFHFNIILNFFNKRKDCLIPRVTNGQGLAHMCVKKYSLQFIRHWFYPTSTLCLNSTVIAWFIAPAWLLIIIGLHK